MLTSQAFWLHLLMLLWAYELAKSEQLLKLARLPLSAPIGRGRYEAARFGSLLLAVLPLAVTLFAVNAAVASWAVAWQGVLYGLSACLAGFLALTLSRFFAPASCVLYSAALVMIGYGLDEFYLYASPEGGGSVWTFLAGVLYVVLPNFSFFDHQSASVAGAAPGFLIFALFPALYAVLLGGALTALSVWRFKKQAL